MMLLDEFTALGRIPIIAESISYLPGYNVRVVLVIQTPAQLREIYGPNNAETMLKSLAARIVFAPKDYADAREISDELGFTTVRVKTVSRPLFDFSDARGRRSRSVTISEQRRALMLAQEVKALGTHEAIVFHEGLRPIRCRKIRYFEDRRFRARLLPPPARAAPGRADRSCEPEGGRATLHGAASPAAVSAAEGPAAAPPATAPGTRRPAREATVDDIDRLDLLTLDDFDADFSGVRIPEKADGERMTAEELQKAAEHFLATLRER
jgi:type IV secretion system protein VirD4